MSVEKPNRLLTLDDYEKRAKELLDPGHYEYIAGGVGDNVSLNNNRKCFDSLFLIPKILRSVSNRSLTTNILGFQSNLPIMIAPTAMNALANEQEAELGVAKAAKKHNIIQILSTFASRSIEQLGELGGQNWFQLYIFKDRKITIDLIRRAERNNFKAIVVTVDTPVFGLRDNLERIGFESPPHIKLGNFQQANNNAADSSSGLIASVTNNIDPNLSWNDITWLKSITKLPIVLKGVVDEEDAELAVQHGVAGIIVSNHGARQLDSSIAPIRALPRIARRVRGRIWLGIDGGVRRGTDVIKCLACGADAVLLGRPVVFALGVNGADGVSTVIERLALETDIALAQMGCTSTSQLTESMIVSTNSKL